MALTDEDKQWIQNELQRGLQQTREGLYQRLEQVETNLLTAFHQWASPADTRIRAHAAAIRALDVEQEALKDRVAKLENAHNRPAS